jgi:hypothetical protein
MPMFAGAGAANATQRGHRGGPGFLPIIAASNRETSMLFRFRSMTNVAFRRPFTAVLALVALALGASAGCRTQQQTAPDSRRPLGVPGPDAAGPHPAPGAPSPVPQEVPSGQAATLTPENRALVLVNGAETWVDAAAAEAEGFTLIDLSDDWTPFIFAEQRSAKGEVLANRYRRVFVGLANDQLDEDGQPLPPGAKNYLELLGVFPSMSVLRQRFVEDGDRTCNDDKARAALEAVDTISYIPPQAIHREAARIARIHADLELARRKAKVKTLAELAVKSPELAGKIRLVTKRALEKPAFIAAEKRLGCEGLLKPGNKHKHGVYDEFLQEVVKTFQQKHMIYEANYLQRATMDALEREPVDNNQRSLMRALRERVVAAAAIIEDGTVTAKDAQGSGMPPVANLADEYTAIVAKALGVDTPQGALEFFRRHPASDFARLRAAVKLPPRPPYYGPEMPLSIVIDRGDVWYDLAFDEKNERLPQPRKKYPSFTIFVDYKGKKVPLAKWRTTVGGWRAEQASDGYEYYRYKGSDVGPRVIRQIVAGPVWIAPDSTPIRGLVKNKVVQGRAQTIVNYSELGPGYMSAYGLVAGYFVIPGVNGKGDFDNGIRAHGSSEYLSMYSPTGFSHGCHRLPNHLAIRLYSFVLRHRKMRVIGDLAMDPPYTRQFLKGDSVYEIRLVTRGFSYKLDPALPVEVLEGEIKGTAKEPILGYVPKPGQRYPGPPPPLPGESAEERAGGGAAGEVKVGDKEKPGTVDEGEAKP